MDLERTSIGIGSRPALVVVDVINGFTDPACPLGSDCPDVVAANKRLLDVMRERQLPIFFTTVIYHDDEQAKVFRKRLPALNVLTPGSHWVQVDAALERRNDEPIIEKCWASGFFRTSLSDQLLSAGADSLIVTGLTTSGCVRATVLDGLQNEYPVIVPKDAVGDRNQNAHLANLHDMHAKYADVVTLESLICELQSK